VPSIRLPHPLRRAALAAVAVAFAAALPARAQQPPDDGIRIDIPVVLKQAKIVLNLDHPAFEGDEPTGLQFLRIMTQRFAADATQASLVAIFHGDAGYMGLDDAAYDRVRHWQGGNPYKAQIAALQQAGVQFEECAETMRLNHWRNADLLPGIKTNTGANFRLVQLVQEGYVAIQP
jgi:intracellular sulfur oxidation DsrE/DsrF family protein